MILWIVFGLLLLSSNEIQAQEAGSEDSHDSAYANAQDQKCEAEVSDTGEAAIVSWIPRGPGGEGNFPALAIDPQHPQTLYAGAAIGGVFKTEDGGQTWTILLLRPDNPPVSLLVVDPQQPQTLYAGAGADLFSSDDAGLHWERIGDGLPASPIRALVIDPQQPQTLYLGTKAGRVYRSEDQGQSWNVLGLSEDTSIFSLLVTTEQTPALYAGTGNGVFKSQDRGASWTRADSGLGGQQINALILHPKDPQFLYAGTNSGVFKSQDGGESWMDNSGGLGNARNSILSIRDAESHHDVTVVVIDPQDPQTLYAATSTGGLFKAHQEDQWLQWNPINDGLYNTNVVSLAFHPYDPQILYAVNAFFRNRLYRSTDGGETWKVKVQVDGRDDESLYFVAIDPQQPKTLYTGRSGRLHKSTTNGEAWTGDFYELSYNDIVAMAVDPYDSQVLYAGSTYSGVKKSEDGGASWVGTELSGTRVFFLEFTPGSLVLYAGTDKGLYVSEDRAQTWHFQNISRSVTVIAFHPQNPQIRYVGTDSGVFKSVDGGQNWGFSGLDGETIAGLVLQPQDPQILYAGTRGKGVYRSVDGGQCWSPFNQGLFDPFINALAIHPQNPHTLYAAAGGHGVFSVTLPVPTAVEESTPLPASFHLEQNYPNPFNSSTAIRFSLPRSGEVELAVYSLTGQRVAVLGKGQREAGVYTVRWDGQDYRGRALASGVYFYRLRAGTQIETRKLLLLR